MTGVELKAFVEQVYFHLNDLVTQGKITATEKERLGPEIVRARLDKEALVI